VPHGEPDVLTAGAVAELEPVPALLASHRSVVGEAVAVDDE
jgi:hypothetical protein